MLSVRWRAASYVRKIFDTTTDQLEELVFPGGDIVRVLLDGRTSNGALSVLDCSHVPGPSDRHVHADSDKAAFVLDGRYLFRVDGKDIQVGPGALVFIPRGVAHDFVVGPDGGRVLFVFSPGGVDEYFRALSALAGDDAAALDIGELRRRHHIEPADR